MVSAVCPGAALCEVVVCAFGGLSSSTQTEIQKGYFFDLFIHITFYIASTFSLLIPGFGYKLCLCKAHIESI